MPKGIAFGWRGAAATEDLLALDAQWVRESLNRQQVQPRRDVWDWTYADALAGGLRKARAAGCQTLLTVRAFSSWASKAVPGAASTATRPPKDLRQYQAFLEALVDRYGSLVDVWQIENEIEDVGGYFGALTVAQYIEMLSAAHEVVPSLCLAGFASQTSAEPSTHPKMVAFAESVLRSAPYDMADAHSYAPVSKMAAQFAWVRARMQVGVPLICTELGWEGSHSESERAADLTARFTAARAAGVSAAFWFLLRDAQVAGNADENGLIRTDGRRKLSFAAYVALPKA